MTLKNKNTIGTAMLTALIAILGGFLLFTSQASAAVGINKAINFQGKVVNADGTNVTNGNYDFVFKLYSVDTGGAAIWTETRTGGNQVTVTDGVFQVDLGEVTTLPGSIDFNTDNIYLGVTFHTDSEMTPRVRFTAVPYAFNADKVHGLTVTDTTGTLTIANGKTISFADAFSTTGAFPLTLTATASTTATLPSGTITLVDLATSQTLTNKIVGSTGLTFTGATTDITTGTGEDLTIVANGAGIISLNDSVTASGAIAANGGITFDAATDTVGAHTLAGTIDASTNILTNIGNAGTDFIASTGALTLAGVLTANGGVSLSGGQSMTAGALSYMDLGSIVHNTTAVQGLRLPQAASATPSNPTSGEGYLAWDTAGNQLITYNGSSWSVVGGGGMSIGGSITSATQGSILFAGAAGVLAQDNASFFFDDTNNRLGLGDATPDAVLDVNLTSTNATAGDEYAQTITLSDTGAVSSGTDNTYGQYINVARTGATGGTLKTYGTYTTLNSAFTSGSGAAYGYGDYISLTGSTVGNNFLHGSAVYIEGSTDFSYGYYAGLTSTGQNIGFETAIVTGGSTSSNQIGFKASVTDGYSVANSFWGAQITTQQTGALSGTETAYGVDVSVQNTGSSGATTNTYGGKIAIVADNAGAGVSTGYGLYVDTSNAGASSVNADTTYALYAMTKANSGTTAYGAYVDAGTGAGTEYSGIFLNGNFGIGDATPAALFTVGASDAFQVNAAGTVSIATGQSYTGAGTVTVSSGGSSGLTIDSASGVTTIATGDYLALSHSGVSGAAAGYLWYDSSDNKYKINENGTTKTLCNTTDLGCGAGGSSDLQATYGNDADGSNATISLTAADDGLVFTNPSSGGNDLSNFLLQLSQANTTATVVALDIIQSSNAANGANITANAIDTETALAITADGLTSGKGLTVNSSSTGLTSAGDVVAITLSGSNASNAGDVLVVSNTGSLNTNTSLHIDHQATGTGNLALRVDDVSGDTTPFVVDGAGNVGIGTAAPNRVLDVVQAASAPQLRLSKDLTYYSEFTVDSVGDLQVAAVGGDIRALSENVWVCDNDACPALTLTGEGNIFVENVLKFGNGVYIKNDSATELSVYDNDDQAMLVFDEL